MAKPSSIHFCCYCVLGGIFSQVDLFRKWKVELFNVMVWRSLWLFLFLFFLYWGFYFDQQNSQEIYDILVTYLLGKLVEFCSEFLYGPMSLLFLSMKSAPVTPTQPPSPPLLICNLTKLHFSECLAHQGLQSFHKPAHTRSVLWEPASALIQELLLKAGQRLLSPENTAAMRTILSERTDEFGHVYDVGCTGKIKCLLECDWCALNHVITLTGNTFILYC